jgi:hypothetical protein
MCNITRCYLNIAFFPIRSDQFYFNVTKGFHCYQTVHGSNREHCLAKSKGRKHPIVPERLVSRGKRDKTNVHERPRPGSFTKVNLVVGSWCSDTSYG